MELSRETLRKRETALWVHRTPETSKGPSVHTITKHPRGLETPYMKPHIPLLGSHPLMAFGKFTNPLTFRTTNLWDPDQPNTQRPFENWALFTTETFFKQKQNAFLIEWKKKWKTILSPTGEEKPPPMTEISNHKFNCVLLGDSEPIPHSYDHQMPQRDSGNWIW